MHFHDSTSSTAAGCAELFADFFKSSFNDNYANNAPFEQAEGGVPNSLTLNRIFLSLADIFEHISQLDCRKGPGPDGIPNYFLNLYL